MSSLVKWKAEEFGNVHKQIQATQIKLQSPQSIEHRRLLLEELTSWRRKEEILWWQRSHVDFLRFGDKNSSWFHTRASCRKAKNTISELKGNDEKLYSEAADLERIVVDFFGDLFTSAAPSNADSMVDLIPSRITEDTRVRQRQPYTSEEVVKALNQMHPGKALRPDGMNPFFIKNYGRLWGMT